MLSAPRSTQQPPPTKVTQCPTSKHKRCSKQSVRQYKTDRTGTWMKHKRSSIQKGVLAKNQHVWKSIVNASSLVFYVPATANAPIVKTMRSLSNEKLLLKIKPPAISRRTKTFQTMKAVEITLLSQAMGKSPSSNKNKCEIQFCLQISNSQSWTSFQISTQWNQSILLINLGSAT